MINKQETILKFHPLKKVYCMKKFQDFWNKIKAFIEQMFNENNIK